MQTLQPPRFFVHSFWFFFFFNDTATTEIYTLSLHDALPISRAPWRVASDPPPPRGQPPPPGLRRTRRRARSEEHTSELQSRLHLVCRLLLEEKTSNQAVTIEAQLVTPR